MTRIIVQDQFYEFYREKIVEFDNERYNCILEGKDYDDIESLNSILDTTKHIIDRIFDGLENIENIRRFKDSSLGLFILLSKPNTYSRYSVKKTDDVYYISIVTDKDSNILFDNLEASDDEYEELIYLLEEISDLIQYAKDKFNKV